MHHLLVVVSHVTMAGICTYISDVEVEGDDGDENGKALWSLEIPLKILSDLWGKVQLLETQRLQIFSTLHYIIFPWLSHKALMRNYTKMFPCQMCSFKCVFSSFFHWALSVCWPWLFSCLVKCCL